MAKLRFHPFFIIYVFTCLYFGWFNIVFYYVVAVVLHEYGHFFVAKVLGYESQGIIFNVYGAGLKNTNKFRRQDDIKISIAGPLVNLVLMILLVCCWWILPSSYIYTLEFFKSNLVVMVFNLIPIYPLDGGRVLVAILEGRFNRKKIIKISNVVAKILAIFLIIIFAISLFYKVNFNLLFIGLFLFLNSMYSDNNEYYEKVKSYVKSQDKLMEVKLFKVTSFEKKNLLKNISPNYYSIFVLLNRTGNKILTEDELLR